MEQPTIVLYEGPYEGEPTTNELLFWKQYHDKWGANSLAIYKVCPACGSDKAEWVRQEYAICFHCLLAFDAFEYYIDLTEED